MRSANLGGENAGTFLRVHGSGEVWSTPRTRRLEVSERWRSRPSSWRRAPRWCRRRFYEDLGYDDIAEAMGSRVGTARTRVHRGLADLRKELER